MNIERYLKFIGAWDIAKKHNFKPCFDVLRAIVHRQVLTVPYQNYELFFTKKPTNLTIEFLQEKLLQPTRNGGKCYELCELQYNALKELGFDAHRVATFVLANRYEFSKTCVKDHNVIVVCLDSKKYLIDTGFGYNSLRHPLEFNFQKTQEVTVQTNEHYQLVCNKDFYQLNMKIKGKWASFYGFERPLRFTDSIEELNDVYNTFLTNPKISGFRDCFLKVGILTETGRLAYTCDRNPENGLPNCNKVRITLEEGVIRERLDYATFCALIQDYISMKVDPYLRPDFCVQEYDDNRCITETYNSVFI